MNASVGQSSSFRGALVATLVALAAAMGCGGADGSDEASSAATTGGTQSPSGAPTYYRDAKPIFDAKCSSCHQAGGIGPFETTSYESVVDLAGLIRAMVVDKRMPPWLASEGCSDYLGDRSLTEAQIETLARWADEGAVEGDPADEGAPLAAMEDRSLSRVDLSLEMGVEYTAEKSPDDYRCFVIDWPETEVKYVTGFRANPGSVATVHHVIAYLAGPQQADDAVARDEGEPGPGYTCFGGPGVSPSSWIGGWAPGGQGNDFPPDTGLKIEPGSKVILQVHYNTVASAAEADRTGIDLRLDDSVGTEAWIQPWLNPQWYSGDGMLIPAGQMDVEHGFTVDPTPYLSDGQPFVMHTVSLHMHTLGKSGSLTLTRADGTKECLLEIPRWDFHWQGGYAFKEPKTIEPGDKIHMECHWDNPTAKDVTWGEGTSDEMCLGGFYLTR